MLVPTVEPPYFGRQRCVFPTVPLADVAPAAAEVASSTLGTGMHGVVRLPQQLVMHIRTPAAVCACINASQAGDTSVAHLCRDAGSFCARSLTLARPG